MEACLLQWVELLLGGLQEASVVRHDLVLRQVKVELQSHEHGELECDELAPVHPKPLLQFLWRKTPHRIHYTAAPGSTAIKDAHAAKDLPHDPVCVCHFVCVCVQSAQVLLTF